MPTWFDCDEKITRHWLYAVDFTEPHGQSPLSLTLAEYRRAALAPGTECIHSLSGRSLD